MKVLFAVNSESISDAIIKKYQRDYREILSYKNVYYFNAILKEIQKDKSYDRIVISEDLEPFSSNNYESIDKFIFEKLDGISDEAHDAQGNEISIILICSDRHTKGSSFLVKIFGISVYNALLGNDRSMEEVCRLIHKPRTKKEAKMYYKIDTDDVNYRAENENEVSELEIQNIIAHFKRLGKNTEKYANSFENIAAQYSEEQLKIIINCLPASVKMVLEETSARYQEIMAASGVMVQGIKSSNVATKQDQKRTGLKIDIIENKINQNKVGQNGPIVIPNSVKSIGSNAAKKVVAIPQKKQNQPIEQSLEKATVEAKKKAPQTTNSVAENEVKRKTIPQQARREDLLRKKENVVSEKTVAQTQKQPVKPVRRSIPVPETKMQNKMEDTLEAFEDIELPDLDFLDVSKKEIKHENQTLLGNETEVTPVVKKGRGRPRKNPVVSEPKTKGKRGRPRKNPVEKVELEEKDEEFDIFADINEQLEMDALGKENDLPKTDESIFEIDELDSLMDTDNEPKEDAKAIELPELDELEDLDELSESQDFEEDALELEEDSFDEFEDYDEYGKYQTKAMGPKEDDIDELYEEDILSEETEDSGLDMQQEYEETEADDLLSDIEGLEENEDQALLTDFDEEEAEEEDDLLLDFGEDEENDLLSDFGDLEQEDALITDFEEDSDNDLLSELEDTDEESVLQQDDLAEDLPMEENDFSAESIYENDESDLSFGQEALPSIESPIDYSMSNLNSLLTKDKKIVTFLGTTKNGVSFLVNNLAEIFASLGINTAILDMTQNKNSYYIYTQNEEPLRKIAYQSMENLQNGMAQGIRVKENLTVYTALPNDGKEYPNAEPILSTLVQNHSLVLIDCDFNTNPSYFASSQEIYLVQSMDILTIQPLTAFLRDLKTQGVLEPEKVRVVINKELKVRGLTNKAIIGGMSFYNDPAMSFMTELFNKDIVKWCTIPFEEMIYSKYLEAMLNCKITINGYSKNFMNKLRILGDMVYPLTSKQTYSSNATQNVGKNNFSNSMNNTLNKMKKKY